MSTSAILVLVLALLTIVGGLTASILVAVLAHRRGTTDRP